MNNLGADIPPGAHAKVDPRFIHERYASSTLFECLGGDGLGQENDGSWHIYGIWCLDGKRGIISSDMIERIVSVPDASRAPLNEAEMLHWIVQEVIHV
jgi:hypothetical protein